MAKLLVTIAVPDGTGAPRMGHFFARYLLRAGHDVLVGCGGREHGPAEDRFIEELRREGLAVHFLPGLASPGPAACRETAELIREQGVDAVIGFQLRDQLAAMKAARRAGVPCVISAQTLHRFWGPGPVPWLKEQVFRRALRKLADLVICSSPAVQEEMQTRFAVPAGRTCFLPNAIDVAAATPVPVGQRQAVRQELGIAGDEQMLINVGRINLQKGQDILLEAFARANAPRLKLVLVGDVTECSSSDTMARYHRGLREFVAERGLSDQVLFAGWRDDVPGLLQSADYYVHAARWEGWPLTVMEAMAARLPVIFTDCSGWPDDFQQDVHGRIVPTGDPDALADAIRQFAAMTPDQRQAMGEAGRRFAEERYDINVVGRRFAELVESVLEPQPAAAG